MGEIPKEMLFKIHNADWVQFMKGLPDECIDFSMTSPPYWSLRDYGKESATIFDGEPKCKHQWGDDVVVESLGMDVSGVRDWMEGEEDSRSFKTSSNFCKLCSAWRGQLGLEPTVDLYTKHLCDGFDQLKRILKSTGSFFLNLGDSYSDKSLKLVPHRVAMEMEKRGWCLRNTIIWQKPNPMPCSVNDRFSTTFEYIFFFVKSRKYYFNLDNVRQPHKTIDMKKPEVPASQKNVVQAQILDEPEAPEGRHGDILSGKWNREDPRPGDRGRTRYGSNLSNAYKGGVPGNPKGKNPGDTVETKAGDVAYNQGAGGESFKRDYLNDPRYAKHYHDDGKNPGDTISPGELVPKRYLDRIRDAENLNDDERAAVVEELVKGISMDKSILEFHLRGETKGVHGNQELSGRAKELDKKGWVVMWFDPRGKNPGDTVLEEETDYWTIPTQPYSGAHFACVDEETECLTIDGWKRHNELRNGDVAAQFNIETGQLSWAPIETVAQYSVQNEPMVTTKSRDLVLRFTPNHRTLVSKRNKHDRLWQRPIVIRADALKPSYGIPVSGEWDPAGEEPMTPEWAELLGWYITEGHEQKTGWRVEIYQSPTANPKHTARIRELLHAVSAEWEESTGYRDWRGRVCTLTAFSISGFAAIRLRELAPRKILPNSVLRWSKRLLDALFTGLIGGDGHQRPDDGRFSFIQKSKETTDTVQAIAVRLGFATKATRRSEGTWTIYLTHKKFIGLRGTNGIGAHLKIEPYTGVIWCPKLPLGTWVARKNGRMFITGNTFPMSICYRPLKSACPPDGIAYDPFSGSGTLAAACEELKLEDAAKWKFRWLGSEINIRYAKIAEDRLRPYITQSKLL